MCKRTWRSLLIFALPVVISCLGRRDDRSVVAMVGDIPIYANDFNREYRRLRQEGAHEQAQKKALLEDIIDRRLLLQEVERANIIVTSSEVEAAFARTRSGWSEEELHATMQAQDLTPAELKNDLRDLLLIRKYLRERVFSRVAVTDQEIEAYVSEHPEVLEEPERVRALHIVCKTESEARQALAEIKAGLSFEDAMIKYSVAPDAKNVAGFGLVPRGVMPRMFDEVCFSLPPGKVSEVQVTDNGYYLFKVLERRPAETLSLAAVRERVERTLRLEKAQSAEEAKRLELRRGVTITIMEDQLDRIH